jgi:nucleotidyltransferase AbiEii toxin of type IV toxin-antitoxin system
VLYGGTAIALLHGHRMSADFDFFNDEPLDEESLRAALPVLDEGRVLRRAPNTLILGVPSGASEVQLSFFGGIDFGRVAEPDVTPVGVEIASPLDLLATKLKVLLQRVEAKDYVDIEVLLRSGLRLSAGLAAASALFRGALNALDAAKAVAWFKDGDLESRLPGATRVFLVEATKSIDPAEVSPLPLVSRRLSRRA